jgi:hypothetical protein
VTVSFLPAALLMRVPASNTAVPVEIVTSVTSQ